MAALALKVFISSPFDVEPERLLARRVLERLENEFGGDVILTPVVWENEPLSATGHFQEEITHPADTDILICILWSRLGTPLPIDKFHRPDGTAYDSGTQWEFEQAVQSWQERQRPYLLVYRKTVDVVASISDDEAYEERRRQKRALDAFWHQWFGGADETFKRAFHTFQTSDQFQDILEVHLRKLIRDRLPPHLTADADAPAPRSWPKGKGSPYRGLEAFDVDHASIFFGRAKAINEVKQQLLHQDQAHSAFVLVFGMSGCGKSSVVRAGVLPALMQPGAMDGIDVWRWCIFRPSDGAGDLFEGLAGALLGEKALPELETMGFGTAKLAEFLREAPRLALAPIGATLNHAARLEAERQKLTRSSGAKLVVIVDQMEELFTLTRADDQQRIGIVAVLSALARSGLAWVIGTMRNDFYPHCAQIPALRALKEGKGQYDLPPPDSGEIRQMICYPAIAAGLSFEKHRNSKIGLDDELLEAAVLNRQALPLLEFTLDELYKQRAPDDVLTLAAYEALGGLEGALSKRADEALASLEKPVQDALPALLRELATIGEGDGKPVVAQRAPLTDLASTPEREALLEAFLKARLLVADLVTDREGERRRVVGVAHEALLRDWPKARSLLENDRDFLHSRDYLDGLAGRWKAEDKNPEYLLRARKDLAVAEDILGRRRSDLHPALIEYIERSVEQIEKETEAAEAAERQRLRARRLGRWAVFATVVIVLSVFLVLGHIGNARLRKQVDATVDAISNLTDVPQSLQGVGDKLSAMILERIVGANDQTLRESPRDALSVKRARVVNGFLKTEMYRRKKEWRSALGCYHELLKDGAPLVKEDRSPKERARDERNLAMFCIAGGNILEDILALDDKAQAELVPNGSPSDAALQSYEDSRKRALAALAEQPDDAEARRILWYSYMQSAGLLGRLCRFDEAWKASVDGLKLLDQRAPGPSERQERLDLATNYKEQGDILQSQGDDHKGTNQLRQAVENWRAAAAKYATAQIHLGVLRRIFPDDDQVSGLSSDVASAVRSVRGKLGGSV